MHILGLSLRNFLQPSLDESSIFAICSMSVAYLDQRSFLYPWMLVISACRLVLVRSVLRFVDASILQSETYIWLEAESGAEYSPIVVKSHPDASQKIALAAWQWDNSGHIDFYVDAPTSGSYYLWARLSTPWNYIRPYRVSVNDGAEVEWAQITSANEFFGSGFATLEWKNAGFSLQVLQ